MLCAQHNDYPPYLPLLAKRARDTGRKTLDGCCGGRFEGFACSGREGCSALGCAGIPMSWRDREGEGGSSNHPLLAGQRQFFISPPASDSDTPRKAQDIWVASVVEELGA